MKTYASIESLRISKASVWNQKRTPQYKSTHLPTIKQIQKIIERYYGKPLYLICSPTRKRPIVTHRQIGMALCCEYTRESQQTIGKEWSNFDSGFDHATVIHACNTINNLMSTDKSIYEDMYALRKMIENIDNVSK